MGSVINVFVECVCFSFFLNLASASDNEFQEKWGRIHKPPRLPSGMIFLIAAVLMVAASILVLCCYWIRRKTSMLHPSPHIPPPLPPAVLPVMSGARTQASQEVHPPVAGAALPQVEPYSQPAYYQPQALSYPHEPPYMGNNTAPLVQPSAAVYSPPAAPFDPPPPYVNQIIIPESHLGKS